MAGVAGGCVAAAWGVDVAGGAMVAGVEAVAESEAGAVVAVAGGTVAVALLQAARMRVIAAKSRMNVKCLWCFIKSPIDMCGVIL